MIPGYQRVERLNMRPGSITDSRPLLLHKSHFSDSTTSLKSSEASDASPMMHSTSHPSPEQHISIPGPQHLCSTTIWPYDTSLYTKSEVSTNLWMSGPSLVSPLSSSNRSFTPHIQEHTFQIPLQSQHFSPNSPNMNRSIATLISDLPEISPNDSASNSRRRSRTVERHSIPTTQAASWSSKLQQLDTPHLCYHRRVLAKVTKWLSGPAFDTPAPDTPFSNHQIQGTFQNHALPPPPILPNAPQFPTHNNTAKCTQITVADIVLIPLCCVAFVPFTIVVMTATTIVLVPSLIRNGPGGVGRDVEGGGG